jgi:CRP-like cAMP-binding protein
MDEFRSTKAPTLREDKIEILRRYGQKRKTEIGDVLFRAGDTQNDFIVILEGEGSWLTINETPWSCRRDRARYYSHSS